MGFIAAVIAVSGPAVAPEFPGSRAAMAAQALGNLAGIQAFLAQGGNGYPVRQGELG